MRITAISNLFPPLCIGGYEIGAARVVRELRCRGCTVQVLSAHTAWLPHDGKLTRHNQTDMELVDIGPCVLGELHRLTWRVPGLVLEARQARRSYQTTLDTFAPDLLLLFNPLGLLAPAFHDAIAWASQRGVPTLSYVSDRYLADWPLAHPIGRLQARIGLAGPCKPIAERTVYCSRHLRDASGGLVTDTIVPWGLPDTAALMPLPVENFHHGEPLALIYAGQIEPHKGLDVLLRALADCRQPHRLTIVGDDHTAFAADCRRLAQLLGITAQVAFVGKQPADVMTGLLPRLGQVLVVPSVWQEPFSLGVLEGMAAGLPVIASRTGGTPEAIADGETGFLFDPRQPPELTALLNRLEEDRDLAWRVGTAAQGEVRRRFTIEEMVDRLLQCAFSSPGVSRCVPCDGARQSLPR